MERSGREPARVVIVTGAASGIGHEVVASLIAADASVLVGAFDRTSGGDWHDPDGRIDSRTVDITDEVAVAEAVAAQAERGRLVGLVNAAGIHTSAPSIDLTRDQMDQVLRVHIHGSLSMAQACARRMIAHGGGAIVNFSSVAADFGWPARLAYAVAKAGIGAMTRTLAVEWAPHGIRVNSIAPGYVSTPMITEAIERGIIDGPERMGMHALDRFARPSEIAAAVLFLLSEEASFITGETLRVDGGFTIKR
jgi:NAD(P)-dependent dehydrogenase (short-subunit alcohol dehydrogenase family)